MKEQQKVADFIDEHDLNARAEFRVLDLVSEVGESEDSVNLLV